jgi:SAM-dependent methyltransferase
MSLQTYREERIAHWDALAAQGKSNAFNRSYHRRLAQVYASLVMPGTNVLEIGCGGGDLLAAVQPRRGVGIDFSLQQVAKARMTYPELEFHCADALEIASALPSGSFDYIILSDLVNDLWDVQAALQALRPYCHARTRLVLNFYSRMWQPVLGLAQALGKANRTLQQNWLTGEDLANLLSLSGFEAIKGQAEVLLPVNIPLLAPLANRFLVKTWPLRLFALANVMVARPQPAARSSKHKVSVIVPARNEAGNIEDILKRVPHMGAGTEIIFVEGHSTDDTPRVIRSLLPRYPQLKGRMLTQDGKGKGDAVRKGFASASGEMLMILDADLTVPPEDLARFYDALAAGKGEFINGVRLVYPMQKQAMRFFNFLGNKFFSLAFTYLLGQPVKDTLCGTKALFKWDYERIAASRATFGEFDPFGDYDLLFGAARLGLKIVDLPVRYGERTYGKTNIQRWRHGWLLLKMVSFAARRLKFV